MRLAFFSPMPPSKSGVADYSAALLEHLGKLHELTVFDESAGAASPEGHELAVYQIGNNPHHAPAYETALEHPGVVVLHEANLHHLIADITIRRDDWDAYMREVAYNGGDEALEFAQRVRALDVGPDYEGVPMLRRVLERSRGVIVHSRFVEEQVRQAGFDGPVAVITHGAWTEQADRHGFRTRLGVDLDTPLIGVYGYLKPYKRILECLRAFRRLHRVDPRVRMILAGEEHPEFPLAPQIATLGLDAVVRRLGYVPPDELNGYIAAADVVVNLRYPTVGESSGTLQRALGLGKASIVSEIGSFAELPDEICLKVPVGGAEEDLLLDYMSLLVSRDDLRNTLGSNARRWVETECSWERAAARYSEFLESVAGKSQWRGFEAAETPEAEAPAAPRNGDYTQRLRESVTAWISGSQGERDYLREHLSRFEKTLSLTPPGAPDQRILEMGAYMQITPALKYELGYGEVRGCYFGKLGEIEHKQVTSANGETFECDIELFDAERDRFPYDDEYFDTVLCCELVEHLPSDPMHMMWEIHRILKPGGHLVMTTPNICSERAVAAILLGYHPGFFPAYIKPAAEGEVTDARHNREYSPREVARLYVDSGFELTVLDTGPFRERPRPENAWVTALLERHQLSTQLRGDGIYAVGRKKGPAKVRFPSWLYDG